jgi:hypothetical protein
MDMPPPPPHPLPALTSYELRDYRRDLERALKALPTSASGRDQIQQHLADVLAEQQSRHG